ncbi:MAG: peptide-methionine (S)-S-oxide reductase MsrA [Candidatus Eisenbacteria bacterium]|nr:peptide-methionine (S)-S-oxide reductase MsrA [Candidatus Eisenbacteria bacterium]
MTEWGTGVTKHEVATLAGGCFWCLEAVFERLRGVESVVPGYSGGREGPVRYEEVCTGATGHAEVTQVTFDPQVLGYRDLLEVFFAFHDPTTLNRQGADVGTQYRSAIFWHDDSQRDIAEALVRDLAADGVFPAPIVTEVVPLTNFVLAEEWHRGYFRRNPEQPYCAAVIAPKVAKLRRKLAGRLKPEGQPAG